VGSFADPINSRTVNASLLSPAFTPDLDMAGALGMKLEFLFSPTGYADRVWLAPSPVAVPVHIHRFHTETFTAEEGDLEVLRDGTWHRLRPGQTLIVPPGAPHSLRNFSAAPVVYRHTFSPGSRFRGLMEGYAALAKAGKISRKKDLRTVLYVCLLFDEYRDVQVFAGALGAVGPVLAAVAKVLGYRLPTH
jgi:mannose-6-phosphate isomerase-like protein (cupin superfamily)